MWRISKDSDGWWRTSLAVIIGEVQWRYGTATAGDEGWRTNEPMLTDGNEGWPNGDGR